MKPAAFSYMRSHSVDETVALLARHGGEAKILAGGQSLVPLLNFRMLRPGILIDVNRNAELDYIREDGNRLRIGALTRHHTLETSPLVRRRVPVLADAMAHVAHLAIRNRGTIGGSLSHGDPAAELPMMALLLDALIHTRSPAGPRSHAARDFFLAPLTTVLDEDEIVTEVELACPQTDAGWAFEEFSQRSGDFAIAAVAAIVTLKGGVLEKLQIALTGVDETPIRLYDIETDLAGEMLSAKIIGDVAQRARAAVNPNSDLKASADYRRHLVAALTERVLTAAVRRAQGTA